MKILKNSTLLLISLFCKYTLYSQGNICKNDSSSYLKIDSLLTFMNINQQNRFSSNKYLKELLNNETFISSSDNYSQDLVDSPPYTKCEIKKYAYLFDLFLIKKLPFNTRLPIPTPRNSRMILGENKHQVKLGNHHVFDLFMLFIDIKKHYEINNRNILSDSDKLSYIENLIKYGSFSYPNIVKNILMLKYKHITRDKLEDDMKYHYINRKK